MNDIALTEINARISRLETSARRWRLVAVACVMVMAGTVVLGAVNKGARVVDVEAIRFLDKKGDQKGFVGVTETGDMAVYLYSKGGEPDAALQMIEDQPVLALYTPNNKAGVILKAIEGGGLVRFEFEDGHATQLDQVLTVGAVSLVDEKGVERGSFDCLKEKGATTLNLRDKDGNRRINLQVTDEEATVLVKGPGDESASGLGVQEQVGAYVGVSNPTGEMSYLRPPQE